MYHEEQVCADNPATPPSFTTIHNYPRTVVQAAELLDRYDPAWAEKINTDALNMTNSDLCVLGQLFSDGRHVFPYGFNKGMRELFGSAYFRPFGEFYGSNLEVIPFGCRTDRDEWIQEINKRTSKVV